VAAMIRLTDIASVFVRYANLTLGGGSATTAVIHGEIVSKRHWVSEEQFALSSRAPRRIVRVEPLPLTGRVSNRTVPGVNKTSLYDPPIGAKIPYWRL